MLSSSKLYRQEIRENSNVTISARIVYADNTEETLDGSRFLMGTSSFNESTSSSSTFEIGASIIGTFNCTIDNSDGHFNERDFTDAVIYPKIHKALSDGTSEVFNKGVFNVEQPDAYGQSISLTCYDNMQKFEKQYDSNEISYPCSLLVMANAVCNACGVTLNTQTFDNCNYQITEEPENTDSLTYLDVISSIAQIGGNYAKMDINGQLHFAWYDLDAFNGDNADGGTFDTTTTPYSDGDDVDGGTFAYNDGATLDGGSFTDDTPYQIYAFNTFSITTDDVVVTGIKAITDESKYLYGDDGYVLSISNDFITDTNAQEIANFVGAKIVGMTFRPFNVNAIGDCTLESGDAVYVVKGDNYYKSYITHINYKLSNYATIECTAETPARNKSVRYSARTKSYLNARSYINKEVSDVYTTIGDLSSFVGDSVADGVVTESEKAKINGMWASLQTEYGDLDTEYTNLYSNTYLKGSAKTTLASTYTKLKTNNNKLSTDITNINNAATKSALDTAIASFNADVTSYNTSLNAFKVACDNAVLNISDNKSNSSIDSYDTALQSLNTFMMNSLGLFKTDVVDTETGATTYFLHNKKALSDSDTQWKLTANGIAVSTDYGVTWTAGITSDGKIVCNALSAIGINADWINTGHLSADYLKGGTINGIKFTQTNTTDNSYLTIQNAEIVGAYNGEAENGIDFSNRVDKVSTLSVYGGNGVRLSAPNLYVDSGGSSTCYKAQTGTLNVISSIEYSYVVGLASGISAQLNADLSITINYTSNSVPYVSKYTQKTISFNQGLMTTSL